VLRRPIESAQYTSLAFGRTLKESRLVASMGGRGDAYDKRRMRIGDLDAEGSSGSDLFARQPDESIA
jgi:hypothetical protein